MPPVASSEHPSLLLVNMFTNNVKRRTRGRPPGPTPQGEAAKDRLYATAIRMIGERGYEQTTLREIAKEADVSVGLLYRYFPGKQAVIIALYEELTTDYARKAAHMKPGRWRDRFMFALETSLAVLQPHRVALRALTPVLVGDPHDGVFAAGTAFSRPQALVRDPQLWRGGTPGQDPRSCGLGPRAGGPDRRVRAAGRTS